MLLTRCQLGAWCGALISLSAGAGPRSAYLPALGPTPLRFQPPPRSELVTVALPPPPPTQRTDLLANSGKDEAESPSSLDPSPALDPKHTTTEIVSTIPSFGPPLPPNFAADPGHSESGPGDVGPSGTERAIPSPQVFLDLLRRPRPAAPNNNTNPDRAAPMIVVPVDFQPPTPAAARSSSATYIKGP